MNNENILDRMSNIYRSHPLHGEHNLIHMMIGMVPITMDKLNNLADDLNYNFDHRGGILYHDQWFKAEDDGENYLVSGIVTRFDDWVHERIHYLLGTKKLDADVETKYLPNINAHGVFLSNFRNEE